MSIATIQRVTVRYEEHEDRLQLATEDSEGNVLALWLTQRLTNRLVAVLLARLAKATAGHSDASTRATMQAWEQSAAYAQHSPQPPVQSKGPVTQTLITSVDISDEDGLFRLVLRWPDDNAVVLPLDSTALRQWLGIVYGHYRQAEWPCDGLWPDWVSAHDQPAPTGAAALSLH
ncbi:hypothetical protein BJN34_21665 [Cupriavidus necator]|uniref:Uncharacterized protein n=2 Tax=Cupriavidus necator TaxID=106590 RepID=A0A1U9UV79_CUPNE|nr:hypothetical protein BJN34_21665 [Cupriavidus necator]